MGEAVGCSRKGSGGNPCDGQMMAAVWRVEGGWAGMQCGHEGMLKVPEVRASWGGLAALPRQGVAPPCLASHRLGLPQGR